MSQFIALVVLSSVLTFVPTCLFGHIDTVVSNSHAQHAHASPEYISMHYGMYTSVIHVFFFEIFSVCVFDQLPLWLILILYLITMRVDRTHVKRLRNTVFHRYKCIERSLIARYAVF